MDASPDLNVAGAIKNTRGGRVSFGRGSAAKGRSQCQICGRLGHLAQRCYYRFDHTFEDAPMVPTTAQRQYPHEGPMTDSDWASTSRGV